MKTGGGGTPANDWTDGRGSFADDEERRELNGGKTLQKRPITARAKTKRRRTRGFLR